MVPFLTSENVVDVVCDTGWNIHPKEVLHVPVVQTALDQVACLPPLKRQQCARHALDIVPVRHVLRDGRLSHLEAELQKLTVDARRAPERVLKASSA